MVRLRDVIKRLRAIGADSDSVAADVTSVSFKKEGASYVLSINGSEHSRYESMNELGAEIGDLIIENAELVAKVTSLRQSVARYAEQLESEPRS